MNGTILHVDWPDAQDSSVQRFRLYFRELTVGEDVALTIEVARMIGPPPAATESAAAWDTRQWMATPAAVLAEKLVTLGKSIEKVQALDGDGRERDLSPAERERFDAFPTRLSTEEVQEIFRLWGGLLGPFRDTRAGRAATAGKGPGGNG